MDTRYPELPDLKKNNGNPEEQFQSFQDIKAELHKEVVDILDLSQISDEDIEDVKQEIRPVLSNLIAQKKYPLSLDERIELIDQVVNEIFGLGPIEPLLKDEEITDILINNHKEVLIEKKGKLSVTDVRFRDNRHLMQVIDRIVSRVGRRIDEKQPMVDARLPDGSRVNVIIPPLALNGPTMSIRRFGINPITLGDLLEYESIIPEFVEFLKASVMAKLNILISGGTGSGKTTLLNVLSEFIPNGTRIITIEDSAELILKQPYTVRLETRPANIEGKGQITQRDLLFNALRMRPDRIIIGEVRGGEAFDMLQAMNTGHEGSMTTVHANSPRDALSRVEMMVSMTGLDVPVRVIRQQIASAINLVIQAARLIDGTRRIVSISEIVGMEGDVITMQEIFRFKQLTIDKKGNVVGKFLATGVRPKCIERIEANGIELPFDLFEPGEKRTVGV